MSKLDTLNPNGTSLAGNLLIATSAVQGSCFDRSVVYLCAHNAEGGMGVIINYPVSSVHLKEVFRQLHIEFKPSVADLPIYFGGPVEANRGFVVHGAEYESDESLISKNGIAVTSSLSILQSLAEGKGPEQAMFVLGYAGWSPGQLEAEIEAGSWIVVPASKELVLEAHNEAKWNMALSTLGIDMGHFSTVVGHA
ncbi:MAG: YqgE/AlgH family protein [Rickettsiales bacterium]|nr:YqgE/AlgH family protein [Rickettsiales bacterium]